MSTNREIISFLCFTSISEHRPVLAGSDFFFLLLSLSLSWCVFWQGFFVVLFLSIVGVA